MTIQDLVDEMAPQVREAAERAKPDILAGLGFGKRQLVKAVWPLAMNVGVPVQLRIAIEFLVAKYQAEVAPFGDGLRRLVIDAIDKFQRNPDEFASLRGMLEILATPPDRFSPAVRACLDPGLDHPRLEYADDE